METPTLEALPNMVAEMNRELNRKLDRLEDQLQRRDAEPETDKLMALPEFQDYHEQKTGRKPARQTCYQWVLDRTVPFVKHGKYLYFRKSSIDAWLANGRQL